MAPSSELVLSIVDLCPRSVALGLSTSRPAAAPRPAPLARRREPSILFGSLVRTRTVQDRPAARAAVEPRARARARARSVLCKLVDIEGVVPDAGAHLVPMCWRRCRKPMEGRGAAGPWSWARWRASRLFWALYQNSKFTFRSRAQNRSGFLGRCAMVESVRRSAAAARDRFPRAAAALGPRRRRSLAGRGRRAR